MICQHWSCPAAPEAHGHTLTHQHMDTFHSRGVHPAGFKRPLHSKVALQGCLLGKGRQQLKDHSKCDLQFCTTINGCNKRCDFLSFCHECLGCIMVREITAQHCQQGWALLLANPALLVWWQSCLAPACPACYCKHAGMGQPSHNPEPRPAPCHGLRPSFRAWLVTHGGPTRPLQLRLHQPRHQQGPGLKATFLLLPTSAQSRSLIQMRI